MPPQSGGFFMPCLGRRRFYVRYVRFRGNPDRPRHMALEPTGPTGPVGHTDPRQGPVGGLASSLRERR